MEKSDLLDRFYICRDLDEVSKRITGGSQNVDFLRRNELVSGLPECDIRGTHDEEKNDRGSSLPGLNGDGDGLKVWGGELLYVLLEGRVKPRVVKQN